MKKILTTAIMLAAITAAPARAEMRPIAKDGYWEATAGTSNANVPMCSMNNFFNPRAILIKWTLGFGMTIHFAKSSWNVPKGVEMPIKIEFENGESFSGIAYGTAQGSLIEMVLNEQAQKFMAEFTSNAMMYVYFPGGTEERWWARLDGSRKITAAFADCIRKIAADSSTQPHGAPPSNSQPHNKQPSQPSQPSQPYSRDRI